MKKGKVYIAGAGPGDPSLITVKAVNILKKADVVLFDRLANESLLNNCCRDVEMIFVGKKSGSHHHSQEEIISLLIEKAGEGKSVLRLKGGDAFVFGRGSEEALALKNAGIDYEIIPGISAGIAATAYAGIPLTHRNLVTQFVFLTAHEAPDKPHSQINWQLLAQMKHTNIVIYMGAAMLEKISETLIENGMSPDMPAAVIENGTMPKQRVLISNITDLPAKARAENFLSPLIIMTGPTIPLRDTIKWLENKPLAGKRIVTTRAVDQSASLYEKLNEEYAEAIPFQSIKTALINPYFSIEAFLNENKFDWLFFTSENGVKYFFEILLKNNLDARSLAETKIAAIGSGTARKLADFNIIADFIPSKFTSADLVKEFPKAHDITNKSVLRVKGNFKRDPLSAGLKKLGAKVTAVNVYKIIKDSPHAFIIKELTEKGADAVMFTSISTVENFFDTLKADAAALFNEKNALALAIGPVTASALKIKNIKNILESDVHTIDGMIETLKRHFTASNL